MCITLPNYKFFFGANAVEGFGNELLRSYITGKKIYGVHLQKSDENYIFEEMGICILPKSPDVVFTELELNINDKIPYGQLELSSYSVIKLTNNKCKILNKTLGDRDGFEIRTIELMSKLNIV